jgi:AraC-like DNA-binding protein
VDLRLEYGQFFGQVLRSRSIAGFSLTETRYDAGARISRHSHESGYICLVRHGSYTETYGKKARNCGPLTVAFHPPDEFHSEAFHDAGALSFNIEIGPRWLERVRPFSRILENSADFHSGRLAGLALQIYKEFRRRDDLAPLAIEGLALELFAEASRFQLRSNANTIPQWLDRTREILHSHFNEPLTVSRIAREVGVHPVYLSTVFRQTYRCSVVEYLRRLRVESACRELVKPGAHLAQIGIASGFSHQSHFTRTFKQLTGLTPGQYRASFR